MFETTRYRNYDDLCRWMYIIRQFQHIPTIPELHAIEIHDSSAQFGPWRVALRSILDIFDHGVAKLDATCRQLQRDVVVLSDPTTFWEWKTMENLIWKYP